MAFLSLYRKYRPLKFSDLVGQQHVVKTLTNALRHDRISHAYLFSGPRGTGKTSTAKVFARALNCEDDSLLEPCGECDNCHNIEEERSVDVIEIDAASNRGIDEIRELREKVKFYPGEGEYKVYIIDEVHMLTTGAFNALLKTLEEPPEKVIFILATTEPRKIISTILSRCQRFDFSLLSVDDIRGRLSYICEEEDVEYEPGALSIIAHSSNGGLRDAISILDQAISYTGGKLTETELREMLGKVEEEILNQMIEYICSQDTAGALELVNELVKSGKGVDMFVGDLIEHVRRLLLVRKCGVDSGLLEFSRERLELLQNEAQKIEPGTLTGIIDILTELEKDLKYTEQPRLMLEIGMVRMTSSRSRELEDRVERLEKRLKNIAGQIPADGETVAGKTGKAGQGVSTGGRSSAGSSSATGFSAGRASKRKTESTGTDKKTGKRKKEKKVTEQVSEKKRSRDTQPVQSNGGTAREQAGSSGDKTGKKGGNAAGELEKVRQHWSRLLQKVKEQDISLEAVLREGKPYRVKNNVLYISFPEGKNFHRKQAREKKDLVARVFNNELGTSFSLRMIAEGEDISSQKKGKNNKDGSKGNDNQDDFVEQVIEAFDGEVIKANTDILDQ